MACRGVSRGLCGVALTPCDGCTYLEPGSMNDPSRFSGWDFTNIWKTGDGKDVTNLQPSLTLRFSGGSFYDGTYVPDPVQKFPLTAESYAISVSSNTLQFGESALGYSAPAAQQLTVTNTGTRKVTLPSLTSTDFVISAPSATVISPGGSAAYTVTPKTGLSVGSHENTVNIVCTNGTKTTNQETVSLKFKVTKLPITPSVSITGWTFGDTPNTPKVSGNPGNGKVTCEYKLKSAADLTYSETVPTNAGTYTVRATVAATANHKGGTATADFTISKPAEVTITFAANGGSGDMAAKSVEKGSSYTLPANGFTAPEGKEFDKWSIGDKFYDAGQSITVNSDITVTAVWKDAPVIGGLRGDVDGNGFVNMQDYALLQRWLANWNVTINKINSDMDGNGDVNMQD